MPKRYGQACPVAKSLDLVGDRWTLLLVRDMLRGARRFQDFQRSLPGIPPNILSDRLKLMDKHGLVTRRFYSDHPPRAEYVLTDKGRHTFDAVMRLQAPWIDSISAGLSVKDIATVHRVMTSLRKKLEDIDEPRERD